MRPLLLALALLLGACAKPKPPVDLTKDYPFGGFSYGDQPPDAPAAATK